MTNVTTETGAGQWGASMAMAAKHFGLELAVYMVKVSYNQKPYRRSIMQTFGAEVIASPSMSTRAGRDIITKHPNYQEAWEQPSPKRSSWLCRRPIVNMYWVAC